MAISLPSHLPANKKQHYSNIEHFKHSLAIIINYFKSEIKAEKIILNDYSQKIQLMLSCNDNQCCVCFDENEEGDGFSVHANPGYMRFVPLKLYWIVVSSPSMLNLQLKNLGSTISRNGPDRVNIFLDEVSTLKFF